MKGISYLGTWVHDWYRIFVNELKLIFTDAGVLIIFFVGGLLYPVLYNLIYMNGTVDEMPVAVVDHSGGSYSRRYLQKVDATRECEILTYCASLEEAKGLMQKGIVHGVILVPADFDSRLTRGEQGVISTYADMSSFLYYKCLTMGTSLTMLDEMHQIQTERYSAAGFDGKTASQLVQPVLSEENMPYNRAFSYTIFFISAALLLVIQQTMFYGSSLLAGTLREQNRSFASMPRELRGLGIGRVILGRGAAYMAVYLCTGTIIALHLLHLHLEHAYLETGNGVCAVPVRLPHVHVPDGLLLARDGHSGVLAVGELPLPLHLRLPGVHQPEHGGVHPGRCDTRVPRHDHSDRGVLRAGLRGHIYRE